MRQIACYLLFQNKGYLGGCVLALLEPGSGARKLSWVSLSDDRTMHQIQRVDVAASDQGLAGFVCGLEKVQKHLAASST